MSDQSDTSSATPPPPLLQATGLCKAFYDPIKRPLLCNLSLSVYPGESIAIVGCSGEGKSTLLHLLGTLDTPCEGSLHILGRAVDRANCHRIRNQHIGFLFQAFHLLEDATALENVLFPASISRRAIYPGSAAHQFALECLDQVGMLACKDRHAKWLSGGEKQRVSLARALVNRPALLLADEPTGNLDRRHSEKIQNLLLDSVDGAIEGIKRALIVVTHDLSFAKRCKRAFQLQGGRLVLM